MQNNTETKIWNATLYLRLSRDDGDKEESNSIIGQRELLRNFIRTRPELREYAVRIDATRGSRGRTGVFLLRLLERFQPLSDAFLLTLRVQLCKLLLVKLLDGKLNGQECVQKASVLLASVLCDDACVLCLNQPSFDQLGHIFAYRVRTHIDGFTNRFVACMALICRPILNVHQIAVDSQRAR